MKAENDGHDPWTLSLAMQAEASALGFDWPGPSGVIDKIVEEAGEIREALEEDDCEHAQRELGDLLLAAVNLSRFLGISPDTALADANARFASRFEMVKSEARRVGLNMQNCSLEELDVLWDHAKRHGSQ